MTRKTGSIKGVVTVGSSRAMFEYHSLGRRRKVTYMKFFVISKNGWSNKIYIQKKSGRGNTLFI